MQIFIDTADIGEIRDAAAMGVIDGVTGNPSLVAKAGRPLEDVLVDVCEVVDGPMSTEVNATDYAGMLEEAPFLGKMHQNIVVRHPLHAALIGAQVATIPHVVMKHPLTDIGLERFLADAKKIPTG